VPVVAIVNGVAIRLYYADHEPAQFHAVLGEAEMLVRIADLGVMAGDLPPAQRREVLDWARAAGLAGPRLGAVPAGPEAGEDRLMELSRIASLEVIPGSQLRLRFADGAEGIVDLAPLVATGGVFATLAAAPPAVVEGGRAIAWRDPDGEEADMDADTLRRMLRPLRAAAE